MATNALLERRGARTALVTTEGFRDVIEIGRQNRPALYDLTRDRPAALVPRDLRFTVRERTGPRGVITPLDEESVHAAVRRCREAGVEAVAVCLIFGFLYPDHERRVGEALRAALPEVHVSLSCEVLPEFREYERCSTTVCDAYLSPRLSRYLRSLGTQVAAHGLPAPVVMQSSGGVAEIGFAASHAASCLLSGPAGGVVGAAWVAGLSGEVDLLTFDMGGTSTDVAPVRGGQVQTTTESVVAGVPVKLPMVDVHTVSAGGGSIAWIDSGGALRVGPHSAGAEPGPAAYGRGGDQPTVTDADLYLGYLADGVELGGEVLLDRAAAGTALLRVGDRIGLDTHRTALGVIRVAEAEMTRALRVISVQRGLDPREFALVAFGGAGGMHACALAEELGIRRILVPRAAGVLSALGLAISDARRDEVAPFLADLATADPAALARRYAELARQATAQLGPGAAPPKATRLADLRYHGQSFELTVAVDGPGPDDERGTDAGGEPADGSRAAGDALPDLAALARHFHREHERRYGYRMDDEPVDLVNLRVVATRPGSRPVLREDPARAAADPATRRASFDGEWREVAVYRRDSLGAGSTLRGPAVVEFAESTCVLRPGWIGTVDGVGMLLLTRHEVSAP